MERTVLPNGIRVLSEHVGGAPSVCVGVWVENGSRYEEAQQGGISHFLEHLFFKGTERRSAAQIAEEIEAVGGVLNAFTGKEYTCYYAKVLSEHLELSCDLLADIFLHSCFAPEEIERERSVILQEISQLEDTPDDYVHDLFNLGLWPGHPLSRPVCGSAETVARLGREDFLRFMEARYRPDRILVAAAGDVRHEVLLERAAAAFGDLDGRAAAVDGRPPRARGGVFTHQKALEQVHLCLGLPAVAYADPDRYPAYLLNTALGGGMSSRLFQEVRERRGKAYSIYSFLATYLDAGYLGVYVGTSRQWVPEVVEVIVKELRRLAREGLGRDELARVKSQLKGSTLLGLETSESRMSRIAKNDIYFGRDVTLEEVARNIEAVTNSDIVRLAERLLARGPLSLTLLGDFKGRPFGDEILGP